MRQPTSNRLMRPSEKLNLCGFSSEISECLNVPNKPESYRQRDGKHQQTQRANDSRQPSRASELSNLEGRRSEGNSQQRHISKFHQTTSCERQPQQKREV